MSKKRKKKPIENFLQNRTEWYKENIGKPISNEINRFGKQLADGFTTMISDLFNNFLEALDFDQQSETEYGIEAVKSTGVKVKSRSEKAIADELTRLGYDYI